MASILLSGGVDFSVLEPADGVSFQENLLRSMLTVERTFLDLAEASLRQGQHVMVVCDRGTMDASAFTSPQEWSSIKARIGMDEIQLRDERYDCVIHMRTAAFGAESYYSTSNHSCRSETVAQARYQCDRALTAWTGHPYLSIIDNSTDFEKKVQRTVAAVMRRCGIRDNALPGTVRSKWLVELTGDFSVPYRDFQVEHHILVAEPGTKTRLRKRGQDGAFVYTLATKQSHGELRRNLSSREYETLLLQADPAHCPIRKLRRCFVWEDQYYHLDYFADPGECIILMESQQPADKAPKTPPFINVKADVTLSQAYTLDALSLIK
ncbi:hypothetical protein PSACC_01398 [Paramicrosporidium saccamoebae]|uniref:NadR/Ttd14 AAA domain-containing protein n=1 Tax=Paramicrosporidium saccamoebae TaxID=1246581 RepID=A0A2H9TMA5_9FUNG|nr:hypothetical protein PSACC_01398 [Paramicrosporidium saccamoebae]